jgi:hypothetical protein
MIIVQELETWWTKHSRGAPAAHLRNATPKALPVPMGVDRKQPFLLHSVRFDETESFSPRALAASPAVSLERPARCIELREHAPGKLVVTFAWNGMCGAPRRPRGAPIQLREGTWCRISYNGRHGSDDAWWYFSAIVNVAFATEPDANVFLNSGPVAVSEHLEDLW